MSTDALEEREVLSEEALNAIGALLERFHEFDLTSETATTRGVTATFKFQGVAGPLAQHEALEAVLQLACMSRALYLNLRDAREELTTLEWPA